MNKQRFKLAFENFDGWGILDTTGEYSDDEDYIDWLSGQKAVDLLNALHEENQALKKQIKALQDANDGLSGTIAHFIEDGDFE